MASSSFLDKLKKHGFEEEEEKREEAAEGAAAPGAVQMPEGEMQLDIDLLQTGAEVILITQIAGVQLKDVAISIEGENDVVVLQGEKKRPHVESEGDEDESGGHKYIHQEGHWGSFYRRILLPGEIIPAEADAEFEDGVLILRMPLAQPTATSGQVIKIHRRKDDDKKK